MTSRNNAIKDTPTNREAERLRDTIHGLGDYGHVTVRPERGHLNIYPDDEHPVARLTPLGAGHYGLSFHKHTGRWEPMPFRGDLNQMAHALVNALGIYLERWDFSSRNSESGH